MHYTEYNQVCSKCDRPTEYKELGRSIIITPCPCQVTELVEACKLAYANLGAIAISKKTFDTVGQALKQAIDNATK